MGRSFQIRSFFHYFVRSKFMGMIYYKVGFFFLHQLQYKFRVK